VHQELERAGITVFERGWLSSNNVLLRGHGGDGAVLVDSGYWTHADQTIALLHRALAGGRLDRIVNTHLHSDHCGGNAAIQAAFGCEIDVPAGEAEDVDAWDEERLTFKATGQHCPRFSATGTVLAPAELHLGRWQWQSIPSPGHDPMSVALYQPELRVLISADALWQDGFGVVFPELEGEDAFAAVAGTLDSFETLDIRLVIPGHGAPFTDFNGALQRARNRLARFQADPAKHALHAAKVLVKFRLLETKEEPLEAFMAWVESASYFELVRRRYFEHESTASWVQRIIGQMSARGSVRVDRGRIWDCG
jgi:glyoxylase-like metal-dependent hydrolase (beta-lactamase superfamily II)